MKILANEYFPRAAVDVMRAAGDDVLWIRESHPAATDDFVLELAVAQDRLLVTFDKDFGELAFKSKLPPTCGIILFRISKQSPELVADRIVRLLEQREDWTGKFSVVEEDRVRMTVLP